MLAYCRISPTIFFARVLGGQKEIIYLLRNRFYLLCPMDLLVVCKSTLIGETACANLQSCGGETLGRHSSTSALKLPLQCDCEGLYDWDNIVGLSSAAFSNPGHRKRALSLQTGRDNALLIQGYSDTFLNQLK